MIYTEKEFKSLISFQRIVKEKLFNKYLNRIKHIIISILNRNENKFKYEPTLFNNNSKKNIKSLETSFKQKQKQMKEGEIAQIVIENYIK